MRPQYWVDSYDSWDLRAAVQWRDLDVSLFLRNVLNEHGGISADASAQQFNANAPVRVAITQPRTVGLTLTYRLN